MSDNDLTVVLEWLHKRLEHELTLDAGTFMVDGALLRGREPDFRWEDESRESYSFTVYMPAFTVES
jgi:hypothetical protein